MLKDHIRSFIAIELEDQTVVERIMYLQKMLSDSGADLKLVEIKNIHITLSFLGDLSQTVLEKIFESMSNIQFNKFEAEIKGVGSFPGLGRINIVWIGILKGSTELEAIFKQLENRLGEIGLKLGDRSFTPHITIARVKSGRNKDKLAKIISENRDYNFGIINVESIKLKKSTLTPEGPIYTTLYEVHATN